ncbi:MAG: thioredoxin domain-containing protein, partial [Stellaceae bacterium]
PDWLALAEQAFSFLVRDMTGADGRLRHSWRAGRSANPATLDDYANLSRAALLLHEATGKPVYLAQARAWVERVERDYADSAGGYFVAAADTEGLLTRPKMVQDSATPSGNGTMVEVLARLYYLTGEDAYRTRAEATVKAFAGDVPKNFFPFGSLLNGNEMLQRAVQIVIRGRRGEPGAEGMLRAVYSVSLPTRVLTVVEPGAALPASHPAAGKAQVEGRATAYVCRGPVCSLPITEAEALSLALDPSTRASGARSG